jgi:hypothetical protein
MKRGALYPVPFEPELKGLINEAAGETRLSKAALIRAALRIGVSEVVKRLKNKKPRRPITDYMDAFAGLQLRRDQELVKQSRFK